MPKQQKDLALMRVKYAAYRNKMRKSGKVEDTMGFKAWIKTSKTKQE